MLPFTLTSTLLRPLPSWNKPRPLIQLLILSQRMKSSSIAKSVWKHLGSSLSTLFSSVFAAVNPGRGGMLNRGVMKFIICFNMSLIWLILLIYVWALKTLLKPYSNAKKWTAKWFKPEEVLSTIWYLRISNRE